MIKIENVSMKFNLEIEKDFSMKQAFVNLFTKKKKKKKNEDFWALKDVSFNIGKGEVVGLIGSNGAGKSTTMNMITGYIEPTKGKIIVNGYDITWSRL